MLKPIRQILWLLRKIPREGPIFVASGFEPCPRNVGGRHNALLRSPSYALERSCLPRYKFTLRWRAVLLRNSPAVLLHFGMRVSRLGIKFVVWNGAEFHYFLRMLITLPTSPTWLANAKNACPYWFPLKLCDDGHDGTEDIEDGNDPLTSCLGITTSIGMIGGDCYWRMQCITRLCSTVTSDCFVTDCYHNHEAFLAHGLLTSIEWSCLPCTMGGCAIYNFHTCLLHIHKGGGSWGLSCSLMGSSSYMLVELNVEVEK